MTPNPYPALVLTPQSDASGPDQSGAFRRAARGDVPHSASEIDGASGSFSQCMLGPQAQNFEIPFEKLSVSLSLELEEGPHNQS